MPLRGLAPCLKLQSGLSPPCWAQLVGRLCCDFGNLAKTSLLRLHSNLPTIPQGKGLSAIQRGRGASLGECPGAYPGDGGTLPFAWPPAAVVRPPLARPPLASADRGFYGSTARRVPLRSHYTSRRTIVQFSSIFICSFFSTCDNFVAAFCGAQQCIWKWFYDKAFAMICHEVL